MRGWIGGEGRGVNGPPWGRKPISTRFMKRHPMLSSCCHTGLWQIKPEGVGACVCVCVLSHTQEWVLGCLIHNGSSFFSPSFHCTRQDLSIQLLPHWTSRIFALPIPNLPSPHFISFLQKPGVLGVRFFRKRAVIGLIAACREDKTL